MEKERFDAIEQLPEHVTYGRIKIVMTKYDKDS